MPKSALTLLTDDHRTVKKLFDEFEATTPRGLKKMADLRDRIVRELSVHAAIEERVLYPVAIEVLPDDDEEKVLEGMQEHAVAEQLLSQVAHMDTDDRWFRPKMMVLIESVRHHIEEEEGELFPQLREAMSDADLRDLGEALEEARTTAPEVPPPSAQARGLLEQVTDRAQEILHRVGTTVGVGSR
jgi:hemerythrin superfamily protein